jgi:hypothetical protein
MQWAGRFPLNKGAHGRRAARCRMGGKEWLPASKTGQFFQSYSTRLSPQDDLQELAGLYAETR